RRGGEPLGRLRVVAPALDPRERLDAALLRLVAGHQHQRGAAVVDRRRVARGDGAVLLERGAQRRQLLDRALARLLVAVDHRLAATTGHADRDDLRLEAAVLLLL